MNSGAYKTNRLGQPAQLAHQGPRSNRVTALPMLLVDMVEERERERERERVTVTERKYIETY